MAQAGGSELFSSAEIAFLAKEELIMIMPKIRMAELKFLHVRKNAHFTQPHAHTLTLPLLPQGTVDEMRPPNPISVPLWLALFFSHHPAPTAPATTVMGFDRTATNDTSPGPLIRGMKADACAARI